MTLHQFIRDSLASVPGDNPGLLLERLCPPLQGQESEAYVRFVQGLAERDFPVGYRRAFQRWQRRTPPGTTWRRVCRVTSQGPVLVGMGDTVPGENGLTTSYPWGVPIIPGTALKGITAAYARARFPVGHAWGEGGVDFRTLFGAGSQRGHVDGEAGAVDFLDAWIEPDGKFVDDVLTPHHSDYYRDGGLPRGWTGPNPVGFIGAQGRFRLVLEGPPEWLAAATELLLEALRTHGVGAKTRAGYGRLLYDSSNPLHERDGLLFAEQEAKRERDELRQLPASERLQKICAPYEKSQVQPLTQALEAIVLGEPVSQDFPNLQPGRGLVTTTESEMRHALLKRLYKVASNRVKRTGSEHSQRVVRVLDEWKASAPATDSPPTAGSETEAEDETGRQSAPNTEARLRPEDFVLSSRETSSQRKRRRKIDSIAKRLMERPHILDDVERVLPLLEEWDAPTAVLQRLSRRYGLPEPT